MPKYRMKPGHRHYHEGQRYEGKTPGKQAEFPDVLELDEERAGRIANKLTRIDLPVQAEEPGEDAQETVSKDPAESKETEQASEETAEDSKPAEGSETKPEESVDENPPLSLAYAGDSGWNVMRGEEKINDVPLSEDEAKALVEGDSK